MARLRSLPSVDIFTNPSGGITITTTDAATRAESAVDLPIEFVPGIIVLLQAALDQIQRDAAGTPGPPVMQDGGVGKTSGSR